MEQELKLQQEQKISQSLIQQMQLLQMTSLELEEYINTRFLDNPVLEVTEPEVPALVTDVNLIRTFAEEQLKQDLFAGIRSKRYSDERKQNNQLYRKDAGMTLAEHLLLQLRKPFSEGRNRKICRFIAESLTGQGYLTETAEFIAGCLRVRTEEVRACISHMKELDPPGVCAANLSECLQIQLGRKKEKDYSIETAVVEKYLSLLARNQLHVIARRLGIPVSRIVTARREIRSLNPYPGSGFADSGQTYYVIPDLTVKEDGGKRFLSVNESHMPTVRISAFYVRLFESPDCDEETRRYLAGKIRQVQNLKEQLRIRSTTLARLGRFIVEYQKGFFQKGPGYLRPLRMQDAAEQLSLHPSTVSRAVQGKYLQCRHGLFPLRYFFSKGFLRDGQDAVITTESILAVLLDVIEKEDRKKPFSDSGLRKQMALRGLEISRRTITKYREKLNIPDSRGRKIFSGKTATPD